MSVLALALVAPLALWAGILLAFARPLLARWREPVLRQPVLIIESDDWGAGPTTQAGALARLSALLQRVRDAGGRPAVMTLGVVLEVPDGAAIDAASCTQYRGLPLADARFAAVRAAIADGMAAGVFVPQLHGQCHYWPGALLAAARQDAAVRRWLTASEPAQSEALPSPLQSRWVDASVLPSHPLPPEAVRQAVTAEAADYAAVFGSVPRVAVATTFVWTAEVETAWARAGVEVVITPGRRATCRGRDGQPGGVDASMLAGDRSAAGQTYLVRDIYFEPALGHGPQRLVDGLLARTRQGRACLVETHRANFLQAQEASLAALEAALGAAVAACPAVRFLSPLELAHGLRARDPAWVESGVRRRLAAWRARLDEVPHFRRAAQWSGLVLPLAWLGQPS